MYAAKLDQSIRHAITLLEHTMEVCSDRIRDLLRQFDTKFTASANSAQPQFTIRCVWRQLPKIRWYFDAILAVIDELHDRLIAANFDLTKVFGLFADAYAENLFDVFVHHVAFNSLRRHAVRRELAYFLTICLRVPFSENNLYDCFNLPHSLLNHCERTLATIEVFVRRSCASGGGGGGGGTTATVAAGPNPISSILRRIDALQLIHTVQNCGIYAPHLGKFYDSGEFKARDHQEGKYFTIRLFLFQHAVVIAEYFNKHHFLFIPKTTALLDFHSFYPTDKIRTYASPSGTSLRLDTRSRTREYIKLKFTDRKTAIYWTDLMRHVLEQKSKSVTDRKCSALTLTRCANVAAFEALNIAAITRFDPAGNDHGPFDEDTTIVNADRHAEAFNVVTIYRTLGEFYQSTVTESATILRNNNARDVKTNDRDSGTGGEDDELWTECFHLSTNTDTDDL